MGCWVRGGGIYNSGTVNLTDYSQFRSAFGKTAPGTEPFTPNDHADFDGDGAADLVLGMHRPRLLIGEP